ncbi:hypothetical protein MNB_SV-15-954 [hydrothermal vent metagenome]|uniref:DUF304 domain-containing protein n=1 Tax=hydrothermal vent metagenome TaxID=652676 RepID=A0A1W1EKL7_9ZZZZ
MSEIDNNNLINEVDSDYHKLYNKNEELIWRGTHRHTRMLFYHIVDFLSILFLIYLSINITPYFLLLIVIPIIISTIKFLEIERNIYEITTKRLKIRKGKFTSTLYEIELYDVKHTVLEEKRNHKGYITFLTSSSKFGTIRFPRMDEPAVIHDKVRDIYEEIKLERNKITHKSTI